LIVIVSVEEANETIEFWENLKKGNQNAISLQLCTAGALHYVAG